MENLFICYTYHHILVATTKVLNDNLEADILVCNAFNSITDNIVDRLKKSMIFHSVYFWDEDKVPNVPKKKIFHYIYYRYFALERYFVNNLFLDFNKFNEIYIFFDANPLLNYLNIKKVQYHLIEDAVDSFKTAVITSPHFYKQIMCENFVMLKYMYKFGIFIHIFGNSKNCKDIEVNSKSGILMSRYNKNKFIERPKEKMFASLTAKNIERIIELFVNGVSIPSDACLVLLLTQPLYKDKYVVSYDIQEKVYGDIINEYMKEFTVIIKPHPRDQLDYSIFDGKNIRILPKSFPCEVLGLLRQNLFKFYITINSTSVFMFPKEKVIFLGPDYLNKYL